MAIYRYPYLGKSDWPAPMRPGDIPASGAMQPLTRAATALSNIRWSATFAYHPGATFSSAQIAFFAPMSGTGRWQAQVITQSTTSHTLSNISIKRMDGSSTYQTWSGTSSTYTNPTDITSSSGTWRTSARMYPGNTTYALITKGASRVAITDLHGQGPLGVTIVGYPDFTATTGTTSSLSGWRNDGTFTPGWRDTTVTPLCAGWARCMATDLEIGELMPVPIGILPIHVSGVTAWEYPWSNQTIRRAMTKQVPLTRGTARAIYIAVGLSSGNDTPDITYQVGAQQITSWDIVYQSGSYTVLRATLSDNAYVSRTSVGGVPIVDCQMLYYAAGGATTCAGMTAWIGEAI